MVLDELEAGALEYVSYKSDLEVDGIMNMVPIKNGPMKMLHDEGSKNSVLRNPDDVNDVSDIMSNMLAEYQVHKEVNGHNHEDVEDDDSIADNNDNKHDQVLKDMKTLSNGVICKNESILLDCTSNIISKEA